MLLVNMRAHTSPCDLKFNYHYLIRTQIIQPNIKANTRVEIYTTYQENVFWLQCCYPHNLLTNGKTTRKPCNKSAEFNNLIASCKEAVDNLLKLFKDSLRLFFYTAAD